MKDRSSIDKISLTFIALTMMAIHHCLLTWKTGEFKVLPGSGPPGGAQHMCDTRYINHVVHAAPTGVFRCLDVDFGSATSEVDAKMNHNFCSIICWRIHSTGRDLAMAQPHNDEGSIDEAFPDYFMEDLIEQPNNSVICLSSSLAATEACMQFSVVLPMGGSAIASSSQPVPCSDRNRNYITNITSIENTGFVDARTIVEGVMSLGG